jgi:hypothetical protein
MRNLLRVFQRVPCPAQQGGLALRFEKNGLVVANEPVPWNADAVVLEAMLKIPATVPWRKSDFQVHIPGIPPTGPHALTREDGGEKYRVQFRLPRLAETTWAEMVWRGQVLARTMIPVLRPDAFLDSLQCRAPTVAVRLDDTTVACQAFLSAQGKGVLASCLFSSPTCLAPLADLDLAVEFVEVAAERTQRVPVRLAAHQWASREALATVAMPRRPNRLGLWLVRWVVAGRVLAQRELRVLGKRQLNKMVHVAEGRFVAEGADRRLTLVPDLTSAKGAARAGPCFLLASRLPGLAVRLQLEVRIKTKTPALPPTAHVEPVLLADSPTPYLPGTLSWDDLNHVLGFELWCDGRVLSFLSVLPAPAAHFTAEGGFRPTTEDFVWSSAAEEELTNRLTRLVEVP